jgi:hypothetical protein
MSYYNLHNSVIHTQAVCLCALSVNLRFNNTVNSQLSRIIMERRCMNNRKNRRFKILCLVHSQNFTNYFTFFYTIDVYFEKKFEMLACFCELVRLLMAVQILFISSHPLFHHFFVLRHRKCPCLSCAGSPVHSHHSVVILQHHLCRCFQNFS